MKYRFVFLVLALSVLIANGQKMNERQLNDLATAYTLKSFPELKALLSIPNDAFFPAEIEKNVKWCETAFAKRSFTTKRIRTSSAPLLLAERAHSGAKKTVLIYLQVDGQPVDTTRWFQASPYIPVLKKKNKDGDWSKVAWENSKEYEDDWRVFARSASDAKGPVVMFLAALDAIAEKRIDPNFNIKVIMDFEEELGSPQLPKAVTENADLLKADMLIIFDGPRHISNKPTLTFGARGIATVALTTYGPIVAQHSGHFGNYAPNPALRLSKVLASMKDDDGRVVIPGFYDGIVIDEQTKAILKKVPDNEKDIKNRLQLGSVDKVGETYQESIQYPSLNIRGMQSGWIDEKARTIIPGWARAEIDIRLVLESDPHRLIGLVKKHIENQGFYVTAEVPSKKNVWHIKK